MARSLDIPERQIAIDHWDDEPGFYWHHRVLLIGAGSGKWIWATPDLEVQFHDLSTHQVVPIPRNSMFPERVTGHLYAFDALTREELDTLRREARALAEVVGVQVPAPPAGVVVPRWVVADPAHERFGRPVAEEITGMDDRFINRGATGMAELTGADQLNQQEWVAVENVKAENHQDWVQEKHDGPGRDLRVLPILRLGSGDSAAQQRTTREALRDFRPSAVTDWPLRGPRAVTELLASVGSSGMEMQAYVNFYIQHSGLSPAGTLSHELRSLFDVMHHVVAFDQLDAPNIAAIELTCRRILQIQRAVRRSPKHPDFADLDSMMSSAIDESGGVVTSKFDQWLAEGQQTKAQIMKQYRMLHDVWNEGNKRTTEREKDAGGGGGSAPSGKKK